MKPAYAVSFVAAVLCHALLLFGFKLEPAHPLELSNDPSPVDVSLVASAPEPAPAEPAPTPPMPEPAPPPEPTPEMSTPPPAPLPTPSVEVAPAPEHPQPAPPPRIREVKPRRIISTVPPAMQGGGHPGTNGPVDVVARYRSNPKPEYPGEAKRLHQEGVVLLSVEVSAGGLATDVTLKRSSGFPMLDQAAIQAVKRWTFEPARAASFPVASRVDVPVRFSLSE